MILFDGLGRFVWFGAVCRRFFCYLKAVSTMFVSSSYTL